MNKLLVAATLILSINASANMYKRCAFVAKAECKEIVNMEDYYKCLESVRNWCIDDLLDQKNGNKSMPWCYDECSLVEDEAVRNLCYETCNERKF